MERNTNLRALRLRHDIPLSELSAASDLSVQYISQAELGEIPPTSRLEGKLGAAVNVVISGGMNGLACQNGVLRPARALCSSRRRANWMNETYYIPTNFTDAGRLIFYRGECTK